MGRFGTLSVLSDSLLAPENTLPAFQAGIDSHAEYIEIDIHLTKDNVFIVMHDAPVNRTTNGRGKVRDLLLTDIVMPGTLQGTQLARALRDWVSDLPVVFMSGYASEATVHGNGLKPSDVRLMKPVSSLDLLSAVSKALRPVSEIE